MVSELLAAADLLDVALAEELLEALFADDEGEALAVELPDGWSDAETEGLGDADTVAEVETLWLGSPLGDGDSAVSEGAVEGSRGCATLVLVRGQNASAPTRTRTNTAVIAANTFG